MKKRTRRDCIFIISFPFISWSLDSKVSLHPPPPLSGAPEIWSMSPPPPTFFLSPSSPSMPESSALPSVWSRISADPQQIVYFARHGGNMDGPLRWLKIYCSAPARLHCDVYLWTGPPYNTSDTSQRTMGSAWPGNTALDDHISWCCACKQSTHPTNCGYRGHKSFNKPHTAMSYNGWRAKNLTLSYGFSRVSWMMPEKHTASPKRSFLLKFMRPLCTIDVLL